MNCGSVYYSYSFKRDKKPFFEIICKCLLFVFYGTILCALFLCYYSQVVVIVQVLTDENVCNVIGRFCKILCNKNKKKIHYYNRDVLACELDPCNCSTYIFFHKNAFSCYCAGSSTRKCRLRC